ncbi:MAG: Uma2 family endonuclease [bacterium]|nr:Uma2 family endonuclease [bacterium]
MSVLSELDPDVAYPATPSVPDSDLHSLVRYLTYGALREHFAGHPDCFVGQDLNIYYRRHPRRASVAPDVFVCYGVHSGDLELAASYRLWDVGAPPAFVLEITSENTYPADLEEKPAKYLEMGVEEYWRLDPTGGDFYTPILQGDRRTGDTWEAIAVDDDGNGGLCGHSGVLNLDLCAQAHQLRLRDPRTGNWIPDPIEMRHQRDHLRESRDAAEARAEAAEARAEAAEAELAALRARPDDQT